MPQICSFQISNSLDVVFHRTGSPEPIRPIGQPSFYPVNLKHRPLNPANVERPGSIRANGRSISRENCSKKVTGNETNRRHASLPTSPSDDVMKNMTSSKRHSIPVSLPDERPYHFLTASFFSTLLSEADNVSVDVDSVDDDRLSMENVEIVLDEDVRLSTEIVYKFCDLVNDETDRGLLTEPALYRMDKVTSSKMTKSKSSDSFDQILNGSSLSNGIDNNIKSLLLEAVLEQSFSDENNSKIIKTRSTDSFEELMNESSNSIGNATTVLRVLPDPTHYVTEKLALNGEKKVTKRISSDSFEQILNVSPSISEFENALEIDIKIFHESAQKETEDTASNGKLSRMTKTQSSGSANGACSSSTNSEKDTQAESNEIFI